MGNLSRKTILGVAAVLTAATTATVAGGTADASTVTKTEPANRAAVTGVAAPVVAKTPAYHAVVTGVAAPVVAKTPAYRAAVTGVWTPAVSAAPAVPAAPAVAAAPSQPMMLVWPLTKIGAVGERVISIQSFLNQRISAGLAVDGVFGSATQAAVIRFQRMAGLTADGEVGQMTWPALIITVQRGSVGPAVFALQHNLHFAYGFSDLDIDGIFGPMTDQAVRTFQDAEHITIDGIAGPVTWNRIILHE
jgi:peptidoglycan hydrolase-like protein with peptidoglycan-binding domain